MVSCLIVAERSAVAAVASPRVTSNAHRNSRSDRLLIDECIRVVCHRPLPQRAGWISHIIFGEEHLAEERSLH